MQSRRETGSQSGRRRVLSVPVCFLMLCQAGLEPCCSSEKGWRNWPALLHTFLLAPVCALFFHSHEPARPSERPLCAVPRTTATATVELQLMLLLNNVS